VLSARSVSRQVLGELLAVVAQPAQVDDLRDAGPVGGQRHGGRSPPVAAGEVGGAQRVHEVVDDVDTLECAVDVGRVGHVGDHPPHSRIVIRMLAARCRDDLVLLGQRRHQRPADHPRRAEHGDPHSPASRISRPK
jgi:hypothetical protein